MSDRRVVITGIGVVSPVGNDLATFWESLKAGRSGIGPIGAFDTTKFDCKIAGEVRDYNPTPFYKTPKDVRRTDRYTQLAVGAAKMALDDGGYDLAALDLDRMGVMIGSGVGGLATMETQVAQM
jgi:3-oxoacyl-[acyl-carrier-protein] synthase II